MFMLRKQVLALALASLFIAPAVFAGAPFPTKDTPKAVDLGHLNTAAGTNLTVTIALKLRNSDEMMSLVQSLYAEGGSQYHQFLDSQQFNDRFGPTDATVKNAMQALSAAGLTVTRLGGNLLKASGSQAAIEAAFGVSLHSFEIPAHGRMGAYRYYSPTSAPKLSPALAANVRGVLGLDTTPRFFPHMKQSPAGLKQQLTPKGGKPAAGAPNTPDQPGLWTVTDFADYYDVNPVYAQGINGKHVTIGIVTLASFTPGDAFTYWNEVGLTVNPNRIRVVNVDGGPGAPQRRERLR